MLLIDLLPYITEFLYDIPFSFQPEYIHLIKANYTYFTLRFTSQLGTDGSNNLIQ